MRNSFWEGVRGYFGHVFGFVVATLLVSVPAGFALWLCLAVCAKALRIPYIDPWSAVAAVSFAVGALTTIRVALRIHTEDL